MYRIITPDMVKASKASNCPLATPVDSRDCTGSSCSSWNLKDNKPCAGFRGHHDYSAAAVMQKLRSAK